MFKHVYWYLLGMKEFLSMITTSPDGGYDETYDMGRDFAHVLTFRYFDNC